MKLRGEENYECVNVILKLFTFSSAYICLLLTHFLQCRKPQDKVGIKKISASTIGKEILLFKVDQKLCKKKYISFVVLSSQILHIIKLPTSYVGTVFVFFESYYFKISILYLKMTSFLPLQRSFTTDRRERVPMYSQ